MQFFLDNNCVPVIKINIWKWLECGNYEALCPTAVLMSDTQIEKDVYECTMGPLTQNIYSRVPRLEQNPHWDVWLWLLMRTSEFNSPPSIS